MQKQTERRVAEYNRTAATNHVCTLYLENRINVFLCEKNKYADILMYRFFANMKGGALS
jgi:hypothetical protein